MPELYRARWFWGALWLAAAVFVGFMVLSPTSDTPDGWLHRWCQWLADLGVPHGLTGFGGWEVVANVAMFAPLGFLGRAAIPELPFWWWLPVGLVMGLGVEAFQAAIHPARDASLRDVVANGLGTGLGAVIAEALAWVPIRTHARGTRR